MEITATLVKELREKTGVGMMECKKALSESQGDLEKAIQYLREKGIATASKKSDRHASEGSIFTLIKGDKGVILEVSCETDFVAKNDDFQRLGHSLCEAVLAGNIKTVEEIPTAKITELVLKLGENISVRRMQVLGGELCDYIHLNGKIGVMVEFSKKVSEELGKDVAMHVAAANPQYLKRDQVPAKEVETEKEIIRNQALNEGRPAQVVDKIVEGRVAKFFKDVCLLEQPFVKDQDKTIQKLFPADTTINQFVRYSIG